MSKVQLLFIAFLITLLLPNSFSMEAMTELNEHTSPGAMQQETLEAGPFTDLPLEINATIVKLLPLKNCLTLRQTAKFFAQFISFIQAPSKIENGLEEVLKRLNNNPNAVSIIFSSNTFSEMRILPKIRALPFLNLITFINPIKSIAFRFNINFNCPVLPLCNIDSLQILKKDCEIALPTKQLESLLKEVFSSEQIIEEIIFEKDQTRNAGFFQLLTSPQSVDLPTQIKIINYKGAYKIDLTRQGNIELVDIITNLSNSFATFIKTTTIERKNIHISFSAGIIFENSFDNEGKEKIKVGDYPYPLGGGGIVTTIESGAIITPVMGPCTLIFPVDDNKKD